MLPIILFVCTMQRRQLELAMTTSLGPLSRALRRAADRIAVPYGLSNAVAWPLLVIGRHHDGIRHGAVACHLGVESPSLARGIDHLTSAGLVTRTTDPTDKRATVLTVTSKGRSLCDELETTLAEFRAEVLKDITDAEIETCLRVFGRLHTALGSKQPDLIP